MKKGFELPQTKLPINAVADIRAAARRRAELKQQIAHELSNKSLARKYNVHERTIEKVISYETARHLP